MQTETKPPVPRTYRGSPRMFEADWLEFFSRVHPATPAVLYLPPVVGAVAVATLVKGLPLWRVLLEVFVGYLGWTLTEYWLHRKFFHLNVVGPKTQRVYFYVHGVHHDYPWDETRLVIPPGASLVLFGFTYLAFRLAFGADNMYGPFAGFVLGYVVYDTVHWYIHARVPKTRFGRWLRREHMVHHFKQPTSRFGVSCPWLDYVFGTRGRPVSAGGSRPAPSEEGRQPPSVHAAG